MNVANECMEVVYSSYQNISYQHIILMANYYMYMTLITTDRVPIWLLGNLQYSVTEN